ncbi:16S rRNA (uracil(1498)-N(3))-methyltransferase [Denitratisoma sp. DHT3]|uniref:16S rRNA (uracil(1498)-N(3))-methyltransferase n=1 Tax=Denitratisoma sp. DHT3 TaxID=1981880 RepID=UPI0011988C4C|nr:16S rRNA (uracil(1498)-N(3))-methyltransferase [Denitratisoma sp. DHT3]QDX82496.1 16S rRNA (uracil(1498)-N(3))-methyltransferase [Denitratisoma sp. DHT3]
MIPRLYCPEPLPPGGVHDLAPAAAHHAVRVLRLGEGDEVRLFDGSGGVWSARIERLRPQVRVRLDGFDPEDREPPLAVTLVQGLPAADKMDWIVQKAVELGVAAIQPVTARRSVVRLSGERMQRRLQHWQAVVVAACEQCGRNRVPVVAPLLDLHHYLAQAAQANAVKLLLAPATAQRLRDLPPPAAMPLHLLIGPEGGFEDDEYSAAASAGFTALGLGPRVLRTETAGPAALAAIMSLWGDS